MMEEQYKNREIDEKFNDIKEQLDRIEEQTTAHNGRMRRVEMILLVVGTATGVLLLTNGSNLAEFILKII